MKSKMIITASDRLNISEAVNVKAADELELVRLCVID